MNQYDTEKKNWKKQYMGLYKARKGYKIEKIFYSKHNNKAFANAEKYADKLQHKSRTL